MISGLRRGVNEIFAVLGCHAAFIGSYLPTFRDNQSVLCWKVKFLDFLVLEDWIDSLSRNVDNYQPMLRNTSEEGKPKIYR
jgi:hypothetical protein